MSKEEKCGRGKDVWTWEGGGKDVRSPDFQEPDVSFPVLDDFRDPLSPRGRLPSLDPLSGDGGAAVLIRRRISCRDGVNLLSMQSSSAWGGGMIQHPVCSSAHRSGHPPRTRRETLPPQPPASLLGPPE